MIDVNKETPEFVQIDLVKIDQIRQTTEGIYVDGTIQQQPLSFLVDTGASVTVIKTSVYQRCPPDSRPVLEEPPAKMVNADGSPIPCLGKGVFNLSVEGSEILHDVWVADINVDGILGFDFLSQHQCLLDISRGVLAFRELPSSPYDDDDDEENGERHIGTVTAKHDYEVPPESEMLISGCLKSQPDSYTKYSEGILEPTL